MTGVEAVEVSMASPSFRSAPGAGAAEAAATTDEPAAAEAADGAGLGPGLRAGAAVAVARHDADRHDDLVAFVEAGGDLGGAVPLEARLHGPDLVLAVDPDGHGALPA